MANVLDYPEPILAWAQGFHHPTTPGEPGYSASGWAIRDPNTGKWNYSVKVSKQPNRRSWPACVRAVHGVMESLPLGATAVIKVPNVAMVNMLRQGFKRTDGKRGAGAEYALDLYAELARKGLRVTFEAEAKGPIVKRLRDEARVAVAAHKDKLER